MWARFLSSSTFAFLFVCAVFSLSLIGFRKKSGIKQKISFKWPNCKSRTILGKHYLSKKRDIGHFLNFKPSAFFAYRNGSVNIVFMVVCRKPKGMNTHTLTKKLQKIIEKDYPKVYEKLILGDPVTVIVDDGTGKPSDTTSSPVDTTACPTQADATCTTDCSKCNTGCPTCEASSDCTTPASCSECGTTDTSGKGGIIFYKDGGPSICDELSPIFSVPPLTNEKKILVPASDKINKILVPLLSELRYHIIDKPGVLENNVLHA